MANFLQPSSLLPLSDRQTAAGDRDPLPFASTLAFAQTTVQPNSAARQESFEAYLNRQSIMRLGRYQNKRFDAVAEILRTSVYKPIGETPFI